jgi:radical SAM protein with 4Fe4S-binding SPASM domain
MWKYERRKLNSEETEVQPDFRLLTVLPTDKCNYRCKMCHIWGENGWALDKSKESIMQEIDIQALKRFVDEANKDSKRLRVFISGGEPLLYKHFDEFITYLGNKKIPVIFLTNGLRIKDHIETILEHVTSVSISLDGPETIHDNIRGNGSFEKVCDSIEFLLRSKKESTNRRNKVFPHININMVLSSYSYKSIFEFIEAIKNRFHGYHMALENQKISGHFADFTVSLEPLLFINEDLGLKYESIMKEHLDCTVSSTWKGFVPEPSDFDPSWLKENLAKLFQNEKVDASDFVDIVEYYSNITNKFGRTKCLAPWHEMVVRSDGNVYPCVDYPDYKLGNIYETSYNELWNGEEMNKFRDLMNKHTLPICNRCCRMFVDYDLTFGY